MVIVYVAAPLLDNMVDKVAVKILARRGSQTFLPAPMQDTLPIAIRQMKMQKTM